MRRIDPEVVKFALQVKLNHLAKRGGEAPRITGVHSACMSDEQNCYTIFDLDNDPAGIGLHFEFPVPASVRTADDLHDFNKWLAAQDCVERFN
jgi:hypothetical protein